MKAGILLKMRKNKLKSARFSYIVPLHRIKYEADILVGICIQAPTIVLPFKALHINSH